MKVTRRTSLALFCAAIAAPVFAATPKTFTGSDGFAINGPIMAARPICLPARKTKRHSTLIHLHSHRNMADTVPMPCRAGIQPKLIPMHGRLRAANCI